MPLVPDSGNSGTISLRICLIWCRCHIWNNLTSAILLIFIMVQDHVTKITKEALCLEIAKCEHVAVWNYQSPKDPQCRPRCLQGRARSAEPPGTFAQYVEASSHRCDHLSPHPRNVRSAKGRACQPCGFSFFPLLLEIFSRFWIP